MGLGDDLMITGIVEQEHKKHPDKQIVIGDLKNNLVFDSIVYFNNPKIKERVLSDSLIFDLIKRDRIEMLLKNNNFQDNELSKFIFSFISTKLFLEQPLFNNR